MAARELLVLGADVGGTNTKIALARFEDGVPALIDKQLYKSAEYAALESVVETFLSRTAVTPYAQVIEGACFAVAGPVDHGRAKLTNLPWILDEHAIAQHLRISHVRVINDFAAAGHGIDLLGPHDLVTLQSGLIEHGADRVVVGAGTGLGVALLDWDDAAYEVHSSEAGHSDFAPTSTVQDELLAYLRRDFERVSCERVLSGAGLARILAFLDDSGKVRPTLALKTAMSQTDPAGAISEFALAERDEAASRALDIFVDIYGAFAGNMALIVLAHGGVYVAGGIAPKIVRKLEDGAFVRAFLAKGRFRSVLETMPVRVVMNDHVGLIGALGEAARVAADNAHARLT